MKNPGYYNDRLLNAPVAFLDMRDVEKENFNQMFVNSRLWEKFVENMVQIEINYIGGTVWINVERKQIL